MLIQRKALIKWTKITLLCGAHSFFWGAMTQASVIAMLLGLATLILMFSLIESHPLYQAKRAANSLLAAALDWGIKIRVYTAFFIAASYALTALNNGPATSSAIRFLFYPYMGELMIGMYALQISHTITGIDLYKNGTARIASPDALASGFDHIVATYSTTIITGLMHTVLLALLCGLIYVGLLIHRKCKPAA